MLGKRKSTSCSASSSTGGVSVPSIIQHQGFITALRTHPDEGPHLVAVADAPDARLQRLERHAAGRQAGGVVGQQVKQRVRQQKERRCTGPAGHSGPRASQAHPTQELPGPHNPLFTTLPTCGCASRCACPSAPATPPHSAAAASPAPAAATAAGHPARHPAARPRRPAAEGRAVPAQ